MLHMERVTFRQGITVQVYKSERLSGSLAAHSTMKAVLVLASVVLAAAASSLRG